MIKIFRQYIQLEWYRWEREIKIQLAIMAGVPLLVFIFYMVQKVVLFRLAGAITALPWEIYAFLGISRGVLTGNISFFIYYAVMILNFWIARRMCLQTIRALWWDEKNGSIYMWMNQLADRKQFVLLKYIWSLAGFWVTYFLWHIALLLIILIGSTNATQRLSGAGTILKLFFQGGFVISILISIVYLCALMKERSDNFFEMILTNWLIFGTLIIGNLYKVRDLILWAINQFNENTMVYIDGGRISNSLHWMDKLVYLSPLSWINPYMDRGSGVFWLAIGGFAVLVVLVIFVGDLIYQKRKLL